jgi:hypothetical protein
MPSPAADVPAGTVSCAPAFAPGPFSPDLQPKPIITRRSPDQQPIDVEPWHLRRLKLVVVRAKAYFRDPKTASSIFRQVTGLEDDKAD